jgi:hypothetical protein
MAHATLVTVQQMTALLRHNSAVDKSRRCGRRVPSVPQELKSADKILRSVHSAARHAYGTSDEREAMTQTIVAYCQVRPLYQFVMDHTQFSTNLYKFI